KLYIYGYFEGIRSSRKLEKECHRNIEVMWLMNNFKTIADFRKDNKQNITNLFKQFSLICNELGLYVKEIIAVEIVEHVFGTVKRGSGFHYFLLRGNEKVKAESHMHFFTYNLKRVINIVGAKKLKEYFKARI